MVYQVVFHSENTSYYGKKMEICALSCFPSELLEINILCGTSGGGSSMLFVCLDNDEPGEQCWEGAHGSQRMDCAVERVLQHNLRVPSVISISAGLSPDF